MVSLKKLADGLAAWWRRTAWQEPARRSPPLVAAGRALLRGWGEALRSFGADQLETQANALTFLTLLSLVPLLAVSFSLFAAFGGLQASEKALHRLIAQNLAPGPAEAAMEHLRQFAARTSAGAVGGVGVVLLFLTVVALLSSIEQSMNSLWGIKRGRPWLARFVVYWTSLTVGPVLLAVSLSLTSAAQSSVLVDRLRDAVPGAAALAFGLVPWVVSCGALTLLYLIVPYAHVSWRAAVGGGVVAGTVWELGKWVFTWASTSLFRYGAVYGSFGALPVFFLWLQVGWVIVLLGCKATYVLQHARALREGLRRPVGPAGRELLALGCMIEVALAFRRGAAPPTLLDLLPGTRCVLQAEQEVLERLADAGLLRAVSLGGADGEADGDEHGYVPGRDPSRVSVEEIIATVRDEGATPAELDPGGVVGALARGILERTRAAAGEVAGALTLGDVVDRAEEGRAHGARFS
jgi:membrane protein